MEEELVRRAGKGDHEAFLELLKRHDRQLMSVVCRFTGNRYDREDLYQDIFLHAFKSIARFRFQASFKTWLYRVALNRCLTYIKKREPVLEAVEGSAPAIDWERNEKVAAVGRAMKRLRGPQQICFHLFYVEQWNQEEIAKLLGCRVGTVKSHMNRARTKIKRDREVLVWQTNPS